MQLAFIVIDELRAPGFKIDEDRAVFSRFKLEIVQFGIFIPSLGGSDTGQYLFFEFHLFSPALGEKTTAPTKCSAVYIRRSRHGKALADSFARATGAILHPVHVSSHFPATPSDRARCRHP